MTALLALVPSGCGGNGGNSGTSGAPLVDRAAVSDVRAAYLDAWDVRDRAVKQRDPRLLLARYAGGDPAAVLGNAAPGARSALDVVSDSVVARITAGVEVAGSVEHDITDVSIADDGQAAQVTDRITDRTYLVDRASGQQRSSAEATTFTEVWFLVRRDGTWKVIYFARS